MQKTAKNARPPHPNRPDFELILSDPLSSFRWHQHDFPARIARWNYHPEFEIHLVTKSTGKMFVGDYIGPFRPGNLVLLGPNLPHHWVSDLDSGPLLEGRDVVLQFPGRLLDDAARIFPEFQRSLELLRAARRGIEFYGESGRRCADLLAAIGRREGLARIATFAELLQQMSSSTETRLLASESYSPELGEGGDSGDSRIGDVIEYIFQHIDDVRMAEAASIVGMNESTFSRHFKRMTGNNFVDCVRKIRVARACTLLDGDAMDITEVCFAAGFRNLSNFNRSFRREKAMTPRDYRSYVRLRGAASLAASVAG